MNKFKISNKLFSHLFINIKQQKQQQQRKII
jgi:hypothetical protein